MADCIEYNCDELDDHTPNVCDDIRLSGVPAAIILECGHAITDPSDPTQINTALGDGTAKLINRAKFAIDEPSPVEVEIAACEGPTVVNYDRSGPFEDPNVSSLNVTFWNGVRGGRSLGGMILYEGKNNKVTFIDDVIKFTGGRVLPIVETEHQKFIGTFKWRDINDPQIFDAPAGIFT